MLTWRKIFGAAVAVILALTRTPAYALDNGLARTPPMGWNSWNSFHCNVDAELLDATADAMVASGMKAAGYTYAHRQLVAHDSGHHPALGD